MIRRTLLVLLAAGPAAADDGRRSTYLEMSPEIRAMQDDDIGNPGMLWAAQGEDLWNQPTGAARKACAECHDAPASMTGVAASYPAWDEASGAAVDLAGRINLCRDRHQKAAPLARDSRELLALETLVALQSRGLPIAPDPDPRLDPARTRGQALFGTRMGQLNLSCASCHQDSAGGHLGAATIPQAHPTGYPQYRLEWQDMGGLHRRFGNCLFGIRARQGTLGDPDYIALELYLKMRAAGMAMEAPAVRP